jgi:hypothetical protein
MFPTIYLVVRMPKSFDGGQNSVHPPNLVSSKLSAFWKEACLYVFVEA